MEVEIVYEGQSPGALAAVENIAILTPRSHYHPPHTYAMDHRDATAKMNHALGGKELTDPDQQIIYHRKVTKAVAKRTMPQTIDIAGISTITFHHQAQKKDTEVFVTSLSEIE